MVLGIDLGKPRVGLWSDDQAMIAARTGEKHSLSRAGRELADTKRSVTLPGSNECVPNAFLVTPIFLYYPKRFI